MPKRFRSTNHQNGMKPGEHVTIADEELERWTYEIGVGYLVEVNDDGSELVVPPVVDRPPAEEPPPAAPVDQQEEAVTEAKTSATRRPRRPRSSSSDEVRRELGLPLTDS